MNKWFHHKGYYNKHNGVLEGEIEGIRYEWFEEDFVDTPGNRVATDALQSIPHKDKEEVANGPTAKQPPRRTEMKSVKRKTGSMERGRYVPKKGKYGLAKRSILLIKMN